MSNDTPTIQQDVPQQMCFKCHVTKPLSHFDVDHRRAIGVKKVCKQCFEERAGGIEPPVQPITLKENPMSETTNKPKAKRVTKAATKKATKKAAKKSSNGHLSAEHKAKISKALKGLTPWNKGKKTGVAPWNKGISAKKKVAKKKASK